MEAARLMVLENIFLRFVFHDKFMEGNDPRMWPVWTPGALNHKTLLHIKYISCAPYGFQRLFKRFYSF